MLGDENILRYSIASCNKEKFCTKLQRKETGGIALFDCAWIIEVSFRYSDIRNQVIMWLNNIDDQKDWWPRGAERDNKAKRSSSSRFGRKYGLAGMRRTMIVLKQGWEIIFERVEKILSTPLTRIDLERLPAFLVCKIEDVKNRSFFLVCILSSTFRPRWLSFEGLWMHGSFSTSSVSFLSFH